MAQQQETLRLRLKDSHDGVAMLLLVAMNHRLQTRMAAQGIFALDSYFDLTTITVWPIFKRVLDAHVASLQTIDARLLVLQAPPPRGTAAHAVTERYRQFAFACLTVEKNEMSEQMMAQSMSTLRRAMGGFLSRMGAALRPAGGAQAQGPPYCEPQRLFLLGNTYAILEQLQRFPAEQDESAVADAVEFWQLRLASHVDEYRPSLPFHA